MSSFLPFSFHNHHHDQPGHLRRLDATEEPEEGSMTFLWIFLACSIVAILMCCGWCFIEKKRNAKKKNAQVTQSCESLSRSEVANLRSDGDTRGYIALAPIAEKPPMMSSQSMLSATVTTALSMNVMDGACYSPGTPDQPEPCPPIDTRPSDVINMGTTDICVAPTAQSNQAKHSARNHRPKSNR